MSYNASYPTWFGQGQAPQYYKPAAQFSALGGATSAAFAAPSGFTSARTLGATQTFGGAQAFAPQAFGTQTLASTQFSSAFPTWFGAAPAPEFYKPAETYQPFAHGAGVHTGFNSGLQPSYFHGSTFGHAPTIASSQFSSAFPTWFGATSAPEFYKPAAQFDASSFGQFGVPSSQVLSGGHTLSHVVGHHGLSSQGASAAAFPTWFGSGPTPDFYKQAPTFDIGQQGFGGHQQLGQQQHQQHQQHLGHHGHAVLGAPQVPGAVDAQHHRLMNELLGFQWVGHGFHSGLRGPGVAIDTATGPSGLPQDPAHQQLMQEVRTFESHEKPGEHPGLKGSGTAIDQASGPKDLPQDPEHKKLMEEVRTHSK